MTQHRLPGWLIGLFVATLALGTDEFVIAGLLPSSPPTCGSRPAQPVS